MVMAVRCSSVVMISDQSCRQTPASTCALGSPRHICTCLIYVRILSLPDPARILLRFTGLSAQCMSFKSSVGGFKHATMAERGGGDGAARQRGIGASLGLGAWMCRSRSADRL